MSSDARLDQRLLDQCYAGFLHPNFRELRKGEVRRTPFHALE
jgi:hypothetical protein